MALHSLSYGTFVKYWIEEYQPIFLLSWFQQILTNKEATAASDLKHTTKYSNLPSRDQQEKEQGFHWHFLITEDSGLNINNNLLQHFSAFIPTYLFLAHHIYDSDGYQAQSAKPEK